MTQNRTALVATVASLAGLTLALLAVDPGRRFVTPFAGCTTGGEHMMRLELVFGMGRRDQSEISADDWRRFLADEVTPRFPDGLTVLNGEGQWRNAGGTIVRETSRVLLIWLRPTAQTEAHIEAIRQAWKSRHRQESVMKIFSGSCVSF